MRKNAGVFAGKRENIANVCRFAFLYFGRLSTATERREVASGILRKHDMKHQFDRNISFSLFNRACTFPNFQTFLHCRR